MNERRLESVYSGVGGLDRWAADCGFDNVDAVRALGVSERTWYRWKEKGLPPGWMRNWIIEKLLRIQRKRRK